MNNSTIPEGGTENGKAEHQKADRHQSGTRHSSQALAEQQQNGAWFNVTITRTYKDDDGDFQDSDSFSRDDLLQVAYVAQQAFDYILNQTDEEEREDDEE